MPSLPPSCRLRCLAAARSHIPSARTGIPDETIVDSRDDPVVLQPGVRSGRNRHASARCHLFARNRSQRCGRHKRFGAGRINSSQPRAQRCHRHDCHSKHKQRRGSLLDPGDFAKRNVRIARDLRRWRNGNGNRSDDSRRRRHDGRRSAVGNIDLGGYRGDVGRIDFLGNGCNIWADRNVRLRIEQHHGIVEPDVDLTRRIEQRRPRRNSAGILRDRESRGQRRASCTDAKRRIAHHRHHGTESGGTDDAGCRTHNAKHDPVTIFICKRERS
jgi:hypothetical protein